MEQVLSTMRVDAWDGLAEDDMALLQLDGARGAGGPCVDYIIDGVHTVKGSCGMFGLHAISSFAHELEATFEHVRGGRLSVSRELINLSLAATDLIRAMFESPADASVPERERIVAALRDLTSASSPS